MNKLKILGISVFCFFILTGCGKSTLECTKSEETDSGKLTEKQIFSFNNNKISKYQLNMNLNLKEEYKDYDDMFLNSLEEPLEGYKNKKGIEYETFKDNGKISVTLESDYSKMDNDTKESLGINEKNSLNEIKNNLEDEGYSCN